jgi:hypothetical protein
LPGDEAAEDIFCRDDEEDFFPENFPDFWLGE